MEILLAILFGVLAIFGFVFFGFDERVSLSCGTAASILLLWLCLGIFSTKEYKQIIEVKTASVDNTDILTYKGQVYNLNYMFGKHFEEGSIFLIKVPQRWYKGIYFLAVENEVVPKDAVSTSN